MILFQADDPSVKKWTTADKDLETNNTIMSNNSEISNSPAINSNKPVYLTWNNINVTVKQTNYRRRLKKYITKNDDSFMIPDKKIVNSGNLVKFIFRFNL